MSLSPAERGTFANAAASRVDRVAQLALRLVAAASPNPPNDTRVVAGTARELLTRLIPDAEVTVRPDRKPL